MPHFHREAKKAAERLRSKPEGAVVDVLDEMTKVTLDVICAAAFGYELNAGAGKHPELVTAFTVLLSQGANHIRVLPGMSYVLKWFCRKEIAAIDSVIDEAIQARLKEQESSSSAAGGGGGSGGAARKRDLLDLLLEAKDDDRSAGADGSAAKGGLTHSEIRDEILVFFLAGHETTALSLTWLAYELAHNQQAMATLLEEIDAIRGTCNEAANAAPPAASTTATIAPPTEPLSPAQVQGMKYTGQALKEVLRLYPPLAMTVRCVPKHEPLTIKGCKLPAGSQIFLPIRSKQLDPGVYGEDATVFKPERWAKESARPPTANFMPFTLGPRTCIGKDFFYFEAKALLAEIFGAVTFELPEEERNLPRIKGTSKTATFHPQRPVLLKVGHRRKSAS